MKRTDRPNRFRPTARTLMCLGILALAACGSGQDLDAARRVPYFYSPPSPLAEAAPGKVIRTEIIQGTDRGVEVRGERIMYHSRTYDGTDIATTGQLFLPPGEPPAQGWPLMAFGHGTTGIIEACAPSLNPLEPIADGYSAYDVYFKPWLEVGFAVVAADYQGQGAPGPYSFLVGRVEGQNLLDSVRAAHDLHGGKLSDGFFLYGHSQGGNSVGFAAEILPAYAPELNLQGVVMAAPAARLEEILGFAYDGTLTSFYGTTFLAMAGLSYEATYGLDPKEIVKPQYAASLLPIFTNVCSTTGGLPLGINSCLALAEGLIDATGKLPPGVVLPPAPPFAPAQLFIPLADYPKPWNDRITENTLGNLPVDAPVFIAQGCKDHTIPPLQTYNYFKEGLCARGENARLNTYANTTHSGVIAAATGDMLAWALAIEAGQTPPSNCESVNSICAQEPDPGVGCPILALLPKPTPSP